MFTGDAARAWVRRGVSVGRRRVHWVIAWGAALVLVLALAAWLARRASPPMPAQQTTLASAAAPISVEQWLLADKAPDWRAARLTDNPAVLVIEFPNLLEQGLTFNRVAALIEKKDAPRGRVLNDTELAALVASSGDNTETFYLGHDYTDVDLARFFSLATAQQLALNAQELRLRALLLRAGILRASSPGHLEAIDRQAVIGFSSVHADNPATPQDESIDRQRRASVLWHELSHAQFFTRADYRTACWTFWTDALNDRERALFRTYLDTLNYDTHNEALMVNETQALLMHTPDARDFNAAALGVSVALLDGWRRRFRQVLDAAPPAPARPPSNPIQSTP